MRFGLSTSGSELSFIGKTKSTVSPFFQVRFSSTYEPAFGKSFTS